MSTFYISQKKKKTNKKNSSAECLFTRILCVFRVEPDECQAFCAVPWTWERVTVNTVSENSGKADFYTIAPLRVVMSGRQLGYLSTIYVGKQRVAIGI